MAILRTLNDLVSAGALGTAEYVISHPQHPYSVRESLIRRYGATNMQANRTSINALIRRAEASTYAAANFSLTGRIDINDLPHTPGLRGSGRYTYNALVTVYQTDSAGNRTNTKETIMLTTSSDELYDYKTLRRRLLQKASAYCLRVGRDRKYEDFCSTREGTDNPDYDVLPTGIYRR